ncbi:antitoxin Xre/MbcA/ParS toxin-binding domain-containing protein [Bradyrhizobium cenepequi]|uniref:antitoxin Xre/MbcA/ParS toxin-binding domain-containing protein n=1 Tax=Bradyrhizobium cenepequi TaxID=2821403 RepID=UPI001CE3A566|nr:antitoxin Xre/MbcA/ParS toxin-binding domain-containing protein [Bradyrhizobium cenepequi]MCA6110456.1 DUF2384 domain-containing protein [Bradyrhizobium cenepequi]
MTNEQVFNLIGQYWSALVGFLIVAAYARQRFNEPTFPNREALPQTVAPLRYLFLPSAYERARRIYVIASLLLYGLLLLPGRQVIEIFGIDAKKFPPQAWALLVALLLVGLLPTTSIKWITMIEEQLRRYVHEWFLVPDGVKKMIAVLEDAPYEPPASQLEAVPDAQREGLQADLKLGRGSLRYRWARATMLMASLNQMGAGTVHPLRKAAFEPFAEDFDAIDARHKILAQDIANLTKSVTPEKEEALKRSINILLRRIYAYISWGVRQQADSDRAIAQTLEALGFSISVVEGRRLFDIVAPAALVIAGIIMAFWLAHDAIRGRWDSDELLLAWSSATAAGAMYGLAAFIALKQRGVQIEQRVWDASPKCLVKIAIRAGLVTWLAIVISTLIWQFGDALRSLAAIVQMDWTAVLPQKANQTDIAAWSFLPVKILTASFWFLAGAAASAILARRMKGDVRRTHTSDRVRDALWLGIGLGLAVALAQLMQSALDVKLAHLMQSGLAEKLGEVNQAQLMQSELLGKLGEVVAIAFVGLVCGAVIGIMVPYACRGNLVTPPDPNIARELRNLLGEAETALGDRDRAENWVFSPHNGLHQITPAEAIQYEGYANLVRTLLNSDAAHEREGTWPDRSSRPIPIAIDGEVAPIVPGPGSAGVKATAGHRR